ncbi:high-affinity nickel-transport protein-domain-containing protein [Abortiporus biennis]|nr:high-affinity nickel-transport protein-domain-containing protein [Abortiporus biennis]
MAPNSKTLFRTFTDKKHIPNPRNLPRLTLFGRSLCLISSEIIANAVCWIVAGILFGRNSDTQPILSLALLAWVRCCLHCFRLDSIAIDNATRSLMNLGQLPVTCGLFFSLGHSTIVIAVNVAIAISTTVYDKIDGVGRVGGIVGASVSASFLFIVGLANSIILWRILAKRRAVSRLERGEDPKDIELYLQEKDDGSSHGSTLMMKIIGPVVTFVDRPWKMYPVGILFGFGFDTASSIALLAVSAIAKKGTDGRPIPSGYIVILPFLFTAGMSLIDSLDSILMLYSYADFPDKSFAIFESKKQASTPLPSLPLTNPDAKTPNSTSNTTQPTGDVDVQELPREITEATTEKTVIMNDAEKEDITASVVRIEDIAIDEEARRQQRVKRNAMSGLSVVLTLMSILVAFSISLITVMGLIGDNCTPCQSAANADDGHGGGLAGRWWRGWAKANDNSGYIGAAIVGAFLTIVGIWYGSRWVWRKYKTDTVTVK